MNFPPFNLNNEFDEVNEWLMFFINFTKGRKRPSNFDLRSTFMSYLWSRILISSGVSQRLKAGMVSTLADRCPTIQPYFGVPEYPLVNFKEALSAIPMPEGQVSGR